MTMETMAGAGRGIEDHKVRQPLIVIRGIKTIVDFLPIAENEYVVKSPFDDDLYQIQYQFPPSVKHPDGEIRTNNSLF